MPRKRSTRKLTQLQESYRRINLSLSKIERKLLSALKRFYNKYIRGKIDPVEIIRQQRGGYIYGLIADAITSAMAVNDRLTFVGVQGTPLLDFVNKQYEQFWKTVSRLRMREDELKVVPETQTILPGAFTPEKKPEFNVEASLLGFSGWLAFAAFNTSILLLSLDTQQEVVFMTVGDKKVDKKICRPLHGRTFNVNDPLTPKPPMHLFCRCMLLPSIS